MVSAAAGRLTSSPRIAIVGAGISGIGVGVKLLRAGITSFEIFEASAGVGGTWRQNRYPGCSVDVPWMLYEYSFKPWSWRRTHPAQAEILEYLERTVADCGLTGHLRLNTAVKVIAWNDAGHHYDVETADGDTLQFDIVVSAVGLLDVPNLPAWKGAGDFRGQIFHTAQWPDAVDLGGKRVAVVGVGSSAAQVVPAIQPLVSQLYVFQREAGWVLPRHSRPYSAEELAGFRNGVRRTIDRWKMLAKLEMGYIGGPIYVTGSRHHRKGEAVARSFIESVFRGRHDLRDAVTPGYVFGGKRRVLSDEYYPSLLNENVTLIPDAVADVDKTGIIDAQGRHYPVDIVVMATGFTAWNYLAHLEVKGRGGADLHDVWRASGGPFAFLGLTVPGFPNFYMMYGPNTNGSGAWSVMPIAEQGADWILSDIKRMRRRGFTMIDTKPAYVSRYNRWMQKRLQRTAWAAAKNYTRAESGRIVTQFHGSMTLRWLLLHGLHRAGTFGEQRQQAGDAKVPEPRSVTPQESHHA